MPAVTDTSRNRIFSALPADCRAVFAWPAETEDAIPLVFERCPGLQRLFLVGPESAGPLTPAPTGAEVRTLDVLSMDAPQNCLERDLLFLCEGKVGVYIAPAHRTVFPAACSGIEKAVLELTRRAVGAAVFRATRGWHRLANLLLNIERAAANPGCNRLTGLMQGQPVAIVGAGPSLDGNIRELAEQQSRILIVACDGALNTLAHHGVVPDLIVSSDDSEKVWRHFAGVRQWVGAVPVLCPLHASWPVARYHAGPMLFGGSRASLDQTVAAHLGGLPFLDVGQCVGHAAFDAALRMGAGPIVMLGFDLGYRGDRFHPEHAAVPYFHEQPPPSGNLLTVPGTHGRPVRTDLSMAMYLREFERRIAGCGVPVWNATEGGALIAGARPVPLKAALSECGGDAAAAKRALREALGAAGGKRPANGTRTLTVRLAALTEAALRETRAALASEEPVAYLARAAAGGPDRDGSAFLRRHGELVDFVSGALDPLALARFLFAWRDRPAGAARAGGPALRDAAIAFLRDLAATADLAGILLRLADRSARSPDSGRLGGLAFAPNGPAAGPWKPVLEALAAAGVEMAVTDCDPLDLPRACGEMLIWRCRVVIAIDGALLPAAWGMPGCVCLDLRSGPPGADVLSEHWLPGYAVVCRSAADAAAWRQRVPADRPVCRSDPAGRLVRLCPGGETVLEWRGLISELAAEAGGTSGLNAREAVP